jgi:hypothetical protein
MMDLALLVYGISLLSGIKHFLIFLAIISGITLAISAIYTVSWFFEGSDYSWNLNSKGEVKERIATARTTMVKIFKRALIVFPIALFLPVLVPSEKTAYTMVGAYAAQKVAENPEVKNISGKVITIINQKLDQIVDDGIAEATKRVEKAEEKVNAKSKSKN